jgi:hypothetical protein
MKLAKTTLMGIGATALIALLLTLSAPKAAHAVVAVLVQVTNTAAAPAITQGVPTLASQMVTLRCSGSSCNSMEPGGHVSSSPYAVPAGQNLVITHVEITGHGGGGVTSFNLEPLPCTSPPCTLIAPGWDVANNGETHEFSISPGFVWPGGASLKPAAAAGPDAIIYGYLTAN